MKKSVDATIAASMVSFKNKAYEVKHKKELTLIISELLLLVEKNNH